VCQAFNSAALAATSSISIRNGCTQKRSDSIAGWLQKYGDGLSALKIEGYNGFDKEVARLSCLPCPHLLDLQLTCLSMPLAPSASTPGLLRSCKDLTRLVLRGSTAQHSPLQGSGTLGCELIQLSALTKLQHLSLMVHHLDQDWDHADKSLALPGSLLSRLVQLTHLDLSDQQLQSDETLEHLSALAALQDLTLEVCLQTATALTALQQLQQLRTLCLLDMQCPVDLKSLPPLTALTA